MATLGKMDRQLRTSGGAKRPAYWYLRNAGRAAVNHLRTRRLTRADPTPPIMMSFVRRSGSTWVSQMLAEVSGIVTIGDPLLERNAWAASKLAGFPLQPMYYDASDIAPARAYLDRTLRFQSRHSTLEGWRNIGLTHPVTPFVKIANAPWLLDWFADEFSAETCLLVRHPIDIARSQLTHWNMPPHLDHTITLLRDRGLLTPTQIGFVDQILREGTDFQKRLIEIVLEYRPIWGAAPGIQTLSYDRLRQGDLDGFAFLDRRDPNWRSAMTRRMTQRSKTTQSANSLETARQHTPAEQADLDRTLDAFDAAGILDRL